MTSKEMFGHDRTGNDPSDPSDDEPGYVHSVAPDPRRLEPLDNPVSGDSLDAFSIVLTYILAYHGRGMYFDHGAEETL
jgi:hypothetical protein